MKEAETFLWMLRILLYIKSIYLSWEDKLLKQQALLAKGGLISIASLLYLENYGFKVKISIGSVYFVN